MESTHLLEALNWRYATKKFDPSKKLNAQQLESVLESIRLTPTSMGLQLFKVLVIENQKLRSQLVEAAYNQQQVKDASHLLVFCAHYRFEVGLIDGILAERAKLTHKTPEDLARYQQSVVKTVRNMTDEKFEAWTAKQCYIALGNAMTACAVMGIDACPMEGFIPAEFDKILGLTGTNLHTCLALPIGFRSTEDKNQHYPKIRKTQSDLFQVI